MRHSVQEMRINSNYLGFSFSQIEKIKQNSIDESDRPENDIGHHHHHPMVALIKESEQIIVEKIE